MTRTQMHPFSSEAPSKTLYCRPALPATVLLLISNVLRGPVAVLVITTRGLFVIANGVKQSRFSPLFEEWIAALRSQRQCSWSFTISAQRKWASPRAMTMSLLISILLILQIGCGSTSGAGSAELQAARGSLNFGSVAVEIPSVPLAAVVVNNSNSAITIEGTQQILGTQASDFQIESSSCANAVLQPQSTCSVSVVFTPSTTGSKSATLLLGSDLSVNLVGIGVIPVANVLQARVTPSTQNTVNALYVNVTICEPGTHNCQTIPNVLVDTGSNGLRLLSSAVTISLAGIQQSGSPLASCVQFADLSYAFGPTKRADIVLAGETAFNIPIQIINQPAFAATPNSCMVSGGNAITSFASLGANGILGIGLFEQDCGIACQTVAIPGFYYRCTSGSCSSTTAPVSNQLQNPVPKFSQDNNGLIISLPPVSASGSASIEGSVIFGIGTQSNNQIGSATLYTTDVFGQISTTYNNNTYASFFDTGSNGMFFLTANETGLQDCTANFRGFYCNSPTRNFTVTNTGRNNASGSLTFNITGAQALITNNTLVAFNNLGGPFPGEFDFGLSFFYGRKVFIGIENKSVGNTSGPLYGF